MCHQWGIRVCRHTKHTEQQEYETHDSFLHWEVPTSCILQKCILPCICCKEWAVAAWMTCTIYFQRVVRTV